MPLSAMVLLLRRLLLLLSAVLDQSSLLALQSLPRVFVPLTSPPRPNVCVPAGYGLLPQLSL